jgi:two-component system, OmpR family, phosphate regulon response regulator PhoB
MSEVGSAPLDARPSDNVVIVDDEEDLLGLIALTLRQDGWNAHTATAGEEGLALVAAVRPVVVVLDLMLPDVSGIEVCRRLRAARFDHLMRIVLVTARGDEYDRVLGFESGADDYVVKPFSVRELAMRVRALARSTVPTGGRAAATPGFRWRGLLVDPLRHCVFAEGVDLRLRPAEYRLLLLLITNAGRVFTRAEVAVALSEGDREMSDRAVVTHVSRLRDALGPYASAVETVPGVGYRLGSEL